jgi:hypothetical protein
MATVNPTVDQRVTEDPDIISISWTPLTTTNADGAPCRFLQHADRTVQVTGTFGAGGTLVWEGSNDGTNYATLTDQSDNNLSFTSAKIEQIMQVPLNSRPRVTGGDGTTSLTVTVVMRRNTRR